MLFVGMMFFHDKEWVFLTNRDNQLVYVTEMQHTSYDVQTIFLNIFIWMP